jgi:DNA-binding response OmpR family regulator
MNMAKIVLIGVEPAAARQIGGALAADGHHIAEKEQPVAIEDLLDVDVVFAGGGPTGYMPLLRCIRDARPSLPFIVVSRIPETNEWLDALEAGATDYCAAPIDTRHLQWLMESALPRRVAAA